MNMYSSVQEWLKHEYNGKSENNYPNFDKYTDKYRVICEGLVWEKLLGINNMDFKNVDDEIGDEIQHHFILNYIEIVEELMNSFKELPVS